MASTLSRRDLLRAAALGFPGAIALGGCTPSDPLPREQGSRGDVASSGRTVVRVIDAQPTSDGAGVKLRRSLGSPALPLLDPFLMLDSFRSERAEDYLAGFPSHPHRGFETVTYMLDGAMEHRDSLGNHGHLGPGSAQWMTAGRGIVHSEMPKQERGLMWGFQLWVNLPATLKMTKPRYQDLAADQIAETTLPGIDGARVRLVAGESNGTRGPVEGIATAPTMLDVALPARGTFTHLLPTGHTAFVYVMDGSLLVGGSKTRVVRDQLAVLSPGDRVAVTSDDGGRMLLLAGAPIGEPVARRGPFVMNTEAELERAFDDYRSGRLAAG